jgi:hypothetical protein
MSGKECGDDPLLLRSAANDGSMRRTKFGFPCESTPKRPWNRTICARAAEDRDYLDELQELIEEAAEAAGGDAARLRACPSNASSICAATAMSSSSAIRSGEPAGPVGFSSN